MHTEDKIGQVKDSKFLESGFGKSLQGEQVWPPKKHVIPVRQVSQEEMDECAQLHDPKPASQLSQG
jgi:hypothetical protein